MTHLFSVRRVAVLLGLALLALAIPVSAIAANPHFISASASGPNNDGTLDVNFKIAGLGDNETITVTASAEASALYACVNGGGKNPNAANKQAVNGPVTASGPFTSGQNGQIIGTLTLNPPPSSLQCPSGQRFVLASVSYTDVQVSGGGDTELIGGPFSRTYFNLQ